MILTTSGTESPNLAPNADARHEAGARRLALRWASKGGCGTIWQLDSWGSSLRYSQKGATIRRLPCTDGLCFSVSLKLRNDPSRQNKRSKRIMLVVLEETPEDYVDGDRTAQLATERRMADLLAGFDPNHDAARGWPEPEVEWVLT